MNGEPWLKNKKITQDVVNQFAIRNIDEMLDKALRTVVFPTLDRENVRGGQPFYTYKMLRFTMFWVVFRLTYGKDSKYDAIDQKIYDDNLDMHLKYRIVPYILFSHVLGRYYYIFKSLGGTFYKYHDTYLDILRKHWDTYMNDTAENKAKNDCVITELFKSDMDRQQIFNEMSNVIGGSIDNASNVMGFILYNVANDHPRNIQQTLYDELIAVHKQCNNNADTFDYNVLKHCHKLRAFIHECMRLHMPNPLGATRYCTKDIHVEYEQKRWLIPKGSVVWWNVANTVYDPSYWDGNKWPNEQIVLERFLENGDINGKFVQRNELMTFGYGKRKCTGRLIVIREFMHLISHFLWRYKVSLSPATKRKFPTYDDIKQGIGFTECKPFGLQLAMRK
eukprot:CAMPEP_0202688328 /NCGR_PEP_ID=MMETSP1385-20130828/3847_1 /ASSEMBLY_ACC=CAM_ASM_000861 /TAXON_ID=933848 /ORGANISM="Elphidium margaritaceum" /LENGTH=391 /DNA_ID=CAMNT_0049343273 /DNA_START=475 /DNA_END=1650 /DNA_ORIENTATION=-